MKLHESDRGEVGVVIGVMVGILTIVACIATMGYGAYSHNRAMQNQHIPVETVYISAMGNSSAISGSFFLGSGFVNETQYYYYMAQEHGGHRMSRVVASDVIVYESDWERPRVEFYYRSMTIVYVPVGTIVFDYHVELQ